MIRSLATVFLLITGVLGRQCENITVHVAISARNGVFNISTPTSNVDVENFILDLSAQGGNYSEQILEGYTTVSGNYSLATTFCVPDKSYNTCGYYNTVQLLTHGIGFDRSYWDLPYNNFNYSYVQYATDQGYATLTWDRLGIGESQHGNPTDEIQVWLEIQALRALTLMLRQGSVPGIPKSIRKIVHIGHSFGSTLSYGLTAHYPTISDGLVLTSFTQNKTFFPWFAVAANFVQANTKSVFAAYPDGYLANAGSGGTQSHFFSRDNFDPKILDFLSVTGQPVTTGELLTLNSVSVPVNNFTGPCIIVIGERDLPFCGGNCTATGGKGLNIPSMATSSLPKVQNFTATIIDGTGHALNLGYSNIQAYRTMLEYLESNDLGPCCHGSGLANDQAGAMASKDADAII